jgi:hypothetical protein
MRIEGWKEIERLKAEKGKNKKKKKKKKKTKPKKLKPLAFTDDLIGFCMICVLLSFLSMLSKPSIRKVAMFITDKKEFYF